MSRLKQTSKRRIRSYQIDQKLGTCFKLKAMFKTSRTQVSGDTGPLPGGVLTLCLRSFRKLFVS